jgi:hypothetical protein
LEVKTVNTANLSLEQTPPLSVPLRFFLTAPLFGLLAAGLLFYDGPLLLMNRWAPHTLALTHLFTLGVITMVMFGAMLQLIAVLAATPVPHPILVSRVLHTLLTVGTLSLSAGLYYSKPFLMQIALIVLGLTFIGFIGVIGYCLVRVKARNPILTGMRLAVIALAVTALLGIALAMLFAYGLPLPMPTLLTDIHLTWGGVGWIGLLVMAIAYQVVPMFQITPHYPPALTKRLIPLLFISLLLWTMLEILAIFEQVSFILPLLFSGLIVFGITLFAVVTLRLQERRLRKLPDITLNYWRVAMIQWLITVALWVIGVFWTTLSSQAFYPILLGVLFFVGFVLSVIQGMLYKIVPFLIWLNLQNQQLNILTVVNMKPLPNMKQIIPDRYARRQFWVYLSALGTTIAAVFWPKTLTPVASVLFMISFLILSYNLYSALWLYRKTSRELKARSA